MKKFAIITIIAGLIQSVAAVEYVTLSTSSKTATVAPNALVEVVGFMDWTQPYSLGTPRIEFTFANGDKSIGLLMAGAIDNNGAYPLPILNQKFTGVIQVRIFRQTTENLEGSAVTLKITPAAEIESAGPKTVLVIPEGSTGDYDVVIESSGDMVTWSPMHSQGVTGSGPQQFFRTRIIKK